MVACGPKAANWCPSRAPFDRAMRASTSLSVPSCLATAAFISASMLSICAPVRLAGSLYTYPYSASMASYSAYRASMRAVMFATCSGLGSSGAPAGYPPYAGPHMGPYGDVAPSAGYSVPPLPSPAALAVSAVRAMPAPCSGPSAWPGTAPMASAATMTAAAANASRGAARLAGRIRRRADDPRWRDASLPPALRAAVALACAVPARLCAAAKGPSGSSRSAVPACVVLVLFFAVIGG